MADKVHEHIGYHRLLLVLGALFLYFFYPTEEVPSIADAGVSELFEAIAFLIPPKFTFYFLLWLALSDTLANLWRLVDFLRQKTPFWNYYPIIADTMLLLLLWIIYRKYVNPLPETPEETTETANLLKRAWGLS